MEHYVSDVASFKHKKGFTGCLWPHGNSTIEWDQHHLVSNIVLQLHQGRNQARKSGGGL
jgi:hypothetical protein